MGVAALRWIPVVLWPDLSAGQAVPGRTYGNPRKQPGYHGPPGSCYRCRRGELLLSLSKEGLGADGEAEVPSPQAI